MECGSGRTDVISRTVLRDPTAYNLILNLLVSFTVVAKSLAIDSGDDRTSETACAPDGVVTGRWRLRMRPRGLWVRMFFYAPLTQITPEGR